MNKLYRFHFYLQHTEGSDIMQFAIPVKRTYNIKSETIESEMSRFGQLRFLRIGKSVSVEKAEEYLKSYVSDRYPLWVVKEVTRVDL